MNSNRHGTQLLQRHKKEKKRRLQFDARSSCHSSLSITYYCPIKNDKILIIDLTNSGINNFVV